MLVIGDIHLQARRADEIIQQIRCYIQQHPDEDTILFLGDYVYHFSYHRKSLLQLFAMFGRLYQQGKTVYILAGNHDRLGEHFVFAEGQQAVQILQGNSTPNNVQAEMNAGGLYFITEPTWIQYHNKHMLLLPHILQPQTQLPLPPTDYTWHKEPLSHIYREAIDNLHEHSTHKGHRLSAHVNAWTAHSLDQFFLKHANDSPIIVHHYYVANTVFPGQKSRFGYKDASLSSQWLAIDDVRLLSGHMHQAFVYQNYLCTGSVRYTSPLEYNQHKFVRKWDSTKDIRKATQWTINPYIRAETEEISPSATQQKQKNTTKQTLFTIENTSSSSLAGAEEQQSASLQHHNQSDGDRALTQKDIEQLWNTFYMQALKALEDNNHRNIDIQDTPKALPLKTTTLHLRASGASYEDLDSYISPDLQQSLAQSKLQQHSGNVDTLLDKLQESQQDFAGGRQDRKNILQEYLRHKVPDQYDAYIHELEELDLL